MLGPSNLSGVCGMMPAFGTDDADTLTSKDTISLDRLADGLEKIVNAGVDSIVTTVTSGEFYTLFPEEQDKLIGAAVEQIDGRIPVLAACVTTHTRETIARIERSLELGVDGVMVGAPFYVPSTADNAVRFFHDVAHAFPGVPMMIYHNPILHRVRLSLESIARILECDNYVAMKDSHRSPQEFQDLIALTRDRMSIFVHEAQVGTFGRQGAAGVWSMGIWMGPEPVVAAAAALRKKDWKELERLSLALKEFYADFNPIGREDAESAMEQVIVMMKLATDAAGYCRVGPLRPPFREVPPQLMLAAQKAARSWRALVAAETSRAKVVQ